MTEQIVTHPNNRAILLEAFPNRRATGADMNSLEQEFPRDVVGIPIVWDSHVSERDIEEVWHPPHDKFVEYGSEDEHWMRPAGLGTVEYIDKGPLFYKVSTPNLFSNFLKSWAS